MNSMKNIITLIIALVTFNASAEFVSGAQLLEMMNGTPIEQSIAMGYVIGATDAGTGEVVCLSNSVTPKQIYDASKKFIEMNIEHGAKSADSFVLGMLTRAFPCDKKQKGSLSAAR
jgi:hypothetical protein